MHWQSLTKKMELNMNSKVKKQKHIQNTSNEPTCNKIVIDDHKKGPHEQVHLYSVLYFLLHHPQLPSDLNGDTGHQNSPLSNWQQ